MTRQPSDDAFTRVRELDEAEGSGIHAHTRLERAFARYIEANPAISGEQRKRAREFADKQRVKGYWDAADCRAICDLLDLIAGPEEVDPLAEVLTDLDTITGSYSREEYAGYIRTALHQAGYEITPITKQEGV